MGHWLHIVYILYTMHIHLGFSIPLVNVTFLLITKILFRNCYQTQTWFWCWWSITRRGWCTGRHQVNITKPTITATTRCWCSIIIRLRWEILIGRVVRLHCAYTVRMMIIMITRAFLCNSHFSRFHHKHCEMLWPLWPLTFLPQILIRSSS